MIILGLIKSRKVQFSAIADGIKMEGDTIQIKSIIHRIEDFFREVNIDYVLLSQLLYFCLGNKGKINISIDRTEWDFGCFQVNILMLMACCGNRHVPLYFELLNNKSGNSNTFDRIDLLEKLVSLVGVPRIGVLTADREFIGHTWLQYLKNKGIHFCIRVPKSHWIERMDLSKIKAEYWASPQGVYLQNCLVDGVWVQVYLKKLTNGELLYLISNLQENKYLEQIYRKRWTIEMMFQSFKSRGFDIESTHIKDIIKLKKLVAIVAIAFSFCVNLGIYQNEKVQKIKIKNNGYKEKSFCRVGIDLLKDTCRKSAQDFTNLITKFFRFLIFQKNKYDKIDLKRYFSDH